MIKKIAAGLATGRHGEGRTPNNPSIDSVKKVLTTKRRADRSTKHLHLIHLCDEVRGRLAAGETISENHPCLVTGRYTADGVKALRQIHRIYPAVTRLELIGGLWTISPVLNEGGNP